MKSKERFKLRDKKSKIQASIIGIVFLGSICAGFATVVPEISKQVEKNHAQAAQILNLNALLK